MGRLVAAGAIDEQEVAAALIEEGKRIGLGTTECERTVTSGMTAGMECSRSVSRWGVTGVGSGSCWPRKRCRWP